MNTILRITFSLLFLSQMAYAQSSNADCDGSINILNPRAYCSDFAEFNNIGGDIGLTSLDPPTCWEGTDHDVWFAFVATASFVEITVFGNTGGTNSGGTLDNPQIHLIQHTIFCNTILDLACDSDTDDDGVAQILFTELTIGVTYGIRVDGLDDNEGSFRICVEEPNSTLPNDDCIGAINLGAIGNNGYCSSIGEYNNGDALPSPVDDCIPGRNFTHDVWFSFVPTSTVIFGQVFGQGSGAPNNIENPQVAIYRGRCNGLEEIYCDQVTGTTLDFMLSNLQFGERLYMRIDGDTRGTFHFCLENVPVANNDDCIGAIELGVIGNDGYCSEINEYNNLDAFPSVEEDCLGGNSFEHDVWFTFTPTNSAVFVQLFGQVAGAPNNIDDPMVGIYRGTCGGLELISICKRESGDILEFLDSRINIRERLYVRIDGRVQGNYHFCIRSFPPIPTPESDCPDAVILCDKSSFVVPNLSNVGLITNELTGPCINPEFNGTVNDQRNEEASVWYAWTCQDPGSLTFVLDPNNPNSIEEDLDWVLYELPNGYDDCANRIPLRCMLSGESRGNTLEENAPCFLATGLREGEEDVEEKAGCEDGSNNFLAPLQMEAGKAYALIVNNFSQSSYGFSIEFGGTGTFDGADPEFGFELVTGESMIVCDTEVVFTDLSITSGDPIVDWIWDFGEDADRQFVEGQGPHPILFNSVGEKTFTLTVVTDRGCEISTSKILNIEECCDNASTDLMIEAFSVSTVCPGLSNGQIIAEASLGNCDPGDEQYTYSLTGDNFQEDPLFDNLGIGFYTVYAQDCKGCIVSMPLEIVASDPITVFAGQDTSVLLGRPLTLNGIYSPQDADVARISWDPQDGFISCINCLDPALDVTRSTTYTLTVMDQNGCSFSDDVIVNSVFIREIYKPNIFNPDLDNRNARFTFGFGRSVSDFLSLRIYDRWGGLVFERENLPLNDPLAGWDGTINGNLAEIGVYSYKAEVRLVDGYIDTHIGSLTLVR